MVKIEIFVFEYFGMRYFFEIFYEEKLNQFQNFSKE